MRIISCFPHLTGMRISNLGLANDQMILTVTVTRSTARCPLCHRRSRRIHSHYHRQVTDLPLSGYPVTLRVHVRRFFCPNPRCLRRIFAERLPALVAPGARRSEQLCAALTQIAFALGGEAGARLAVVLGLPATPDILLRLIRAAPLPAIGTPRSVGVDDFALRKGRTYAGVIVDIDAHRPLDILPDCTAATIAAWFAAHPSITLVSRDRGTAIVEGVTRGAPQAIQVADRWHLLKNLGDALECVLVRTRAEWHPALVSVTPEQAGSETVRDEGEGEALTLPVRVPTPRALQAAQEQEARRARRIAREEEVRRLHGEGWSDHAIARTLHLSRTTVQVYLSRAAAPLLQVRARKRSKLDPYKAYLTQRWQEGCHNARVLLDEVHRRGYSGGHAILREYVATFRGAIPSVTISGATPARVHPAARATWSPRQLVALMLRRPKELTEKQARALGQIRAASPMLEAVYAAGQGFAVMVRERNMHRLTEWVEEMRHGPHRELRGFAAGLLEDYAAVRAGLTLPESNGPTEGHINKLKLVKRAMYGRGKVDLLRQRVVWRG